MYKIKLYLVEATREITPMFIAVTQLEEPRTNGKINKWWHIHTVEYY